MKMKEINTKLIASVALVSLLTAGSLFAQKDTSSSSEENIVLPEVTTTVSGDSLTAGKDSLPDFTKILPSHEDGVGLLPQLPGVTAVEIPEEPEAVLEAAPERAVYAQGLLGAGYPGYFIGDFSIYKSSGDDPFLLQFTHTQSNGYGQKLAGDGFFDTDTTMLCRWGYLWNTWFLFKAGLLTCLAAAVPRRNAGKALRFIAKRVWMTVAVLSVDDGSCILLTVCLP